MEPSDIPILLDCLGTKPCVVTSYTVVFPFQLDMTGVVSAVFAYNNATFSGGAIYADESSTSITADEYNHTLAQNRFGLCFALFGNEFNTQPVSLVRQYARLK